VCLVKILVLLARFPRLVEELGSGLRDVLGWYGAWFVDWLIFLEWIGGRHLFLCLV